MYGVLSGNCGHTSKSRRSDALARLPIRTSNFRTPTPIANHSTHAGDALLITMSTQLPLRRIRIPSLRQQCLFQRHHNRPQYLALFQPSTAARTFTSTPSRPAKRRQLGQDKAQSKAAAQGQVGPSPRVGLEKAQTSTDAMAEDIGLLQNTIIRPPLSELWRLGVGGLSKYTWDFVKSKGTGMYS
jgi:protein MBA1